MAQLYKKLEAYSKTDFYPFHMPGHKRNIESTDGRLPFEQDITEIDGFDNLHHAEEILLDAQKTVAEVYGTMESFYSVNGSTAGLLSAVSAAVKKGGKMLVARNCHKAVYHAMYLRDIHPIYLYPPMHPKWGINGGILPEDVEKGLEENPDVQAVLITSPTYDGVVSDVEKIAEIAHKYGVPLIVDEAHGAHFAFSDYFPVSAAELGADVVIQSFHKTLPSMTQTAVLHRCSDRISRELLTRFLGIYQTSSPSYVLMASMDACMEKLKKDGKEMFRNYTEMLEKARVRLAECKNLQLIPETISGEYGIFDYDRSKILISTCETSVSGNTLSEVLRDDYHLEMEMAAENYITALTAVGDTEEGFQRLCEAVLEIDRRIGEKSSGEINQDTVHRATSMLCTGNAENRTETKMRPVQLCIPLEQKLFLSEAMDTPSEPVVLEDSEDCISAEFAYFYPPGIPVIVPGERITAELLINIRKYLEQGFVLQGMKDYTNRYIQIVKESKEENNKKH